MFLFLQIIERESMLPTDPKKAAQLGKAWGEVLAESIFGVADVLKNGKNMKAAANSKQLQENAATAAKNAVIRAKNEAKIKEQHEAAYMKMSHTEREAYKKILQEQRVSTTVKKAQDDEMIGVGHILLIIFVVLAIFGALGYGAFALGIIHR
jgi:preprotein translocase subunit SecF